jgi:hypothetical protein
MYVLFVAYVWCTDCAFNSKVFVAETEEAAEIMARLWIISECSVYIYEEYEDEIPKLHNMEFHDLQYTINTYTNGSVEIQTQSHEYIK